ncbi:MAG: DapH/DapD/GlmU-related protein [Xenococcaceae cyanobacterium MO_234.B1]|nr:DapH/DapD/GlmU-related protein [Xenococcaceae cyanobacterium MO_234.B1]
MTHNEPKESLSSVFALGFPINLALELIIQFTSLVIPVALIVRVLHTASVVTMTLTVLAALYIYPLMILIVSGVVARLLPKPKKGILTTPSDALKFQILTALSAFVRRTPARGLLIFPFPAYLFYKISGAQIDSSVISGYQDAIQDIYYISIGKNTVLGWGCLIFSHYVPDPTTTKIGEVKIGNDVLIGAGAIIWPGVTIGDRSIIQNKSVVKPDTIIPSDEVWGGIPARKIRNRKIQAKKQENISNDN